MKQQISTPTMVAALIGVLLIAGLIGWWTLGSSSAGSDPDRNTARIKQKRASGKF